MAGRRWRGSRSTSASFGRAWRRLRRRFGGLSGGFSSAVFLRPRLRMKNSATSISSGPSTSAAEVQVGHELLLLSRVGHSRLVGQQLGAIEGQRRDGQHVAARRIDARGGGDRVLDALAQGGIRIVRIVVEHDRHAQAGDGARGADHLLDRLVQLVGGVDVGACVVPPPPCCALVGRHASRCCWPRPGRRRRAAPAPPLVGLGDRVVGQHRRRGRVGWRVGLVGLLVWSQFISALTRTVALPRPEDAVQHRLQVALGGAFRSRAGRRAACWSGPWWSRRRRSALSVLPLTSMIVRFSGLRPSTLPATRLLIERA